MRRYTYHYSLLLTVGDEQLVKAGQLPDIGDVEFDQTIVVFDFDLTPEDCWFVQVKDLRKPNRVIAVGDVKPYDGVAKRLQYFLNQSKWPSLGDALKAWFAHFGFTFCLKIAERRSYDYCVAVTDQMWPDKVLFDEQYIPSGALIE